jgi:aspartate aminotransferase
MPNISEKGRLMPESPIRKLVPYADQAKKRGTKVFHLNIGQPDIPTPQSMIDAMHNLDIKVIEYSHSAGILSYRESMCKYYAKHGIKVSPDEIIVGAGASEAILFAVQTCLNPGDEIIIPEPFYANYNGFATSAGVKVKPIISSIESGFALPPISEFEKAITPATKAIMVCNPNNPTGYLYSREELETLREIVLKHDLFLFADEVYREFCYDGTTHFSVMNLEGLEDHVVLFDSVSKRYSAVGCASVP